MKKISHHVDQFDDMISITLEAFGKEIGDVSLQLMDNGTQYLLTFKDPAFVDAMILREGHKDGNVIQYAEEQSREHE